VVGQVLIRINKTNYNCSNLGIKLRNMIKKYSVLQGKKYKSLKYIFGALTSLHFKCFQFV